MPCVMVIFVFELYHKQENSGHIQIGRVWRRGLGGGGRQILFSLLSTSCVVG